jgi:hypothetical protein
MDEKKYTLDDIETLRSKTGVGYEEAVALLEKYDGDIARALVELEKRGRLNRDGLFSGANRDRAEDFLSRWWRIGCETRVIVEHKGKTIINFSALFMILALILGWKLILVSAVLALILGCHVRVHLSETLKKAEAEPPKPEPETTPESEPEEEKKDDQDGYHTITIE